MLEYEKTLKRMLEASGLKNSSRLAYALGITPQALSNYKRKGNMPSNLLLEFVKLYPVTLDSLISDEGVQPTEKGLRFEVVGKAIVVGDSVCPLRGDESIYVDRLLTILRTSNPSYKSIIKLSLDIDARAKH
jgi:transcriptional regulator with XRE-family HTH domain